MARLLLSLTLAGAVSASCWAVHAPSKSHATHPKKAAAHHKKLFGHVYGAPVYAGKTAVMIVYGTTAASAQKHAISIQARVDQNLKLGTPESKVTLRKVGKVLTVCWGGHTLSTVDALQAEGNHSKPRALGEHWVSNLQAAVRRQTFSVSEKSLVLGVGDSHALHLHGELAGATTVKSDSSAFTATVENGRTVTVKATRAGSGVLMLHRGRMQIPVKVTAEDVAGQVPASMSCTVTGDPASKGVVNDALVYALKGSIHLTPGATIYVKGEPTVPDTLMPGSSTTLLVPLSLEGNHLVPVRRTVHVTVTNRPVVASPASLLMVSNRPENLDGNGVVFSGKFGPGRPARLLYAHENRGTRPRQVCVTLTNRSDRPAQVFLVSVPGTPGVNEGLAATGTTSIFLQRLAQNSGVVLTIPPRTGWEVMQESIPVQQRVVGMAHFECLSGEDLEVTVHSRENGVPLTVASRTVLSDPAGPGTHPKGTFASPDVPVAASYRAGDEPSTIDIGKSNPLVDTATGESDTGNYGVLYKISVKISNPSDHARRVSLSFGAGDSPSRACFLMGQKIKETPMVPAGTEEPLDSVELGPNDIRTVELTTVAAPGYNLPARLVLRTESEVPAANP